VIQFNPAGRYFNFRPEIHLFINISDRNLSAEVLPCHPATGLNPLPDPVYSLYALIQVNKFKLRVVLKFVKTGIRALTVFDLCIFRAVKGF
jgi:hypothetical protein